MKIYDCFMYFDEEEVLDLRLNILKDKIDYFVIVESTFNHKGERRKLLFDKSKFEKFNSKIIYLVFDKVPDEVQKVSNDDSLEEKDRKYIMNAVYRENSQRNYIYEGLKKCEKNDLILISDVDEIPKLNFLDLNNLNNEIVIFRQDMFYYKFNLLIPNFKWSGTKGVLKKNLISPQWLRNIKDRKYPFYRFDTHFSNKKYTNIKIISDGGWHFSNLKSPAKIEHKLRSYLHHREFDKVSLTVDEINTLIKNKRAIYDLNVDKKVNKVGNGVILENFNLQRLPSYIQKNLNKYKDWID